MAFAIRAVRRRHQHVAVHRIGAHRLRIAIGNHPRGDKVTVVNRRRAVVRARDMDRQGRRVRLVPVRDHIGEDVLDLFAVVKRDHRRVVVGKGVGVRPRLRCPRQRTVGARNRARDVVRLAVADLDDVKILGVRVRVRLVAKIVVFAVRAVQRRHQHVAVNKCRRHRLVTRIGNHPGVDKVIVVNRRRAVVRARDMDRQRRRVRLVPVRMPNHCVSSPDIASYFLTLRQRRSTLGGTGERACYFRHRWPASGPGRDQRASANHVGAAY